MKRVKVADTAPGDALRFRVSGQERLFLNYLLQLYPVLPLEHHQLSRGSKTLNREENRELLRQSLASQQDTNRKLIGELLVTPGRFQVVKQALEFSVTRAEAEELLQIFNDVRVGSWLALGSPDNGEEEKHRGKDTAAGRHVLAMDLAGAFQMELLHALSAG